MFTHARRSLTDKINGEQKRGQIMQRGHVAEHDLVVSALR